MHPHPVAVKFDFVNPSLAAGTFSIDDASAGSMKPRIGCLDATGGSFGPQVRHGSDQTHRQGRLNVAMVDKEGKMVRRGVGNRNGCAAHA
jgi:hypothetical protein